MKVDRHSRFVVRLVTFKNLINWLLLEKDKSNRLGQNIQLTFNMKQPLNNHQRQVVVHGNSILRVDSVARCSIERLDIQSSLYEFEERHHVPTFAVKFCDGENRKSEVICNECINIVCCIVLVDHHAYPFLIILQFLESCEHKMLVTNDTFTLVYRPFCNHLSLYVVISYVQTIVVFVIKFSCLLDKVLGQVVVNVLVLGLIQIGKCGVWDKRKNGMVQLTLESCKGSLIGAKTLLGSELCEAHHHELVTAGELDLMSVAIVPCDTLVEDVLWEQRHDLGEYTLTLIHLVCSLHYYHMQRH